MAKNIMRPKTTVQESGSWEKEEREKRQTRVTSADVSVVCHLEEGSTSVCAGRREMFEWR